PPRAGPRRAIHAPDTTLFRSDGSATAPTSVKLASGVITGYAVVASFTATSNYNLASASATEVITKATPTVKILNGTTDVTGGTATVRSRVSPQGTRAAGTPAG